MLILTNCGFFWSPIVTKTKQNGKQNKSSNSTIIVHFIERIKRRSDNNMTIGSVFVSY